MIFRPSKSERAAAIFSDKRQMQSMLDVEAALARAESRCGIFPTTAAEAIAAQCQAELFDLQSIAAASTMSGNVAIPLVRELTKRVAASSPGAEAFVHWGATSQDILDSALVLQLRDLFAITHDALNNLCEVLAKLVRDHAATPMAGRTWLQHATPTTLGLKFAGALDAVLRHQERLSELTPRVLVLQFGGAAGTLASLGKNGDAVSAALAEELKLRLPDVPWHSYRDRIVEIAGFYAGLTTTIGKLANDLALLMQTEVAELAEPQGEDRGGSSTMPHKQNPVLTAEILSQAARVPALQATMLSTGMLHQHERGLTGWQTEWVVLPELLTTSQSILEAACTLIRDLTVDTEAMRMNLGRTRGFLLAESVSMALAPSLGRSEAHALLQRIVRTAGANSMDLATALRADPQIMRHLTHAEIDHLLNPENYLGSAPSMVQRVLERYAAYRKSGGQ